MFGLLPFKNQSNWLWNGGKHVSSKNVALATYQEGWKWKGFLFIAPAAIVLFIMVIYPLISGVGYAFTDYDGLNQDINFVGLENFKAIISDNNFWLIVKNTIIVSAIYVITLNILAVFLSVLIMRVGKIFGNLVKSVLYIPCLIAMAIVGFIWRLIYNYNDGILNKFLSIFKHGLIQDWLGNPNLVLISTSLSIVWFALGYYMVIYCAGLMSIPVDLYEVADIEGAGRWQTFKKVTLPLLAPSITINVVLSSMAIFACFDLPYVLTAGGGPGYYGTTLAISVYRLAYVSRQMGKSFAMAAILAVFSIVIAIIELKLLLKKEEN